MLKIPLHYVTIDDILDGSDGAGSSQGGKAVVPSVSLLYHQAPNQDGVDENAEKLMQNLRLLLFFDKSVSRGVLG